MVDAKSETKKLDDLWSDFHAASSAFEDSRKSASKAQAVLADDKADEAAKKAAQSQLKDAQAAQAKVEERLDFLEAQIRTETALLGKVLDKQPAAVSSDELKDQTAQLVELGLDVRDTREVIYSGSILICIVLVAVTAVKVLCDRLFK